MPSSAEGLLPAADPCVALGIDGGLVVVAGAGGKKSTIYALARTFHGLTGATTTVNCPVPPADEAFRLVVGNARELPALVRDAARRHSRVFFACPGKRRELLGGVAPSVITDIYASGLFDAIFVKADGARCRLMKAPGGDEPVYPKGATQALYLVSAHAFGRRVDSGVVHRLPELMAVTGVANGARLEPVHLIRLLTSEAGALKGIEPGTRLVVVINRVDTAARYQCAQEVAKQVLAATDRVSAVALACMGERPPLVAVMARA